MYEKLFRDLLYVCIKNNQLDHYLFGKGGAYVSEGAPLTRSPHAVDYAVLVLNEVNAENPSLNLAEKFNETIENELAKEQFESIGFYYAFRCIYAQSKLEYYGNASFKLSDVLRKKLISAINSKMDQNSEQLSNCKYAEGEMYKNGIYGYIKDVDHDFYNKTGSKLL